MLEIVIPKTEMWDENSQIFVYTKEQTLRLEHSLVSLSKWESKWCKPFLTNKEKTEEETIDYIRCMTLSQNVDPNAYRCITNKQMEEIFKYIQAPMTATTFSQKDQKSPSKEQITAELIYYWMIACNIPFECQKWHINKLLTLIRVCEIKNTPPKKMSKRELMARNASLNAARRKRLNTKG